MSILPNKCVFMLITIPYNNMINLTQSKELSLAHSTTIMSSCLDVNLNVIRMLAVIYLAASVLNTESASKAAYHKKMH